MIDCRHPFRSLQHHAAPVGLFGCGYLGKAIALELHRQQIPLRAFSRSGQWEIQDGDFALPQRPPEGLELQALDLCTASDEELRAALSGLRSAIFCYAPGRGGDEQSRRDLYVQVPERLLHNAGPGLERVIAVSSTSALPDFQELADTATKVNESCPIPPAGNRGQTQRDAEICIATQATQKGVSWCILRLAGLYGPGRGLARIYRRYLAEPETESKAPSTTNSPDRITNFVSRLDARNAVLQALDRCDLNAHLFNVCCDDHRSRQAILQRLRSAQIPNAISPPHVAEPKHPLQGKIVCNRSMKRELGLILCHPELRFDFDYPPVA